MADVLSDVRKGLEKRLHELEPLVQEHAQVHAALEALKSTTAPIRRVARTGAKAAAAAGAATGRRGRPRGTGNRAQEALSHVHKHPGITIAELAKRMKIKPNYLYRVLPHLEKDGKVKKDGKG